MNSSSLLAYLGMCVLLTSCTAVQRQHVFGKPRTDEKVELDIVWDDEVMEVMSHTHENAPKNFRETTSRYFFERQLVAVKDPQSNRCYIQKTEVTRESNTSKEFENIKEEWIKTSQAVLVSPLLFRSRFGPEIAEFCRYEQVYDLNDGSFGIVPDRKTSAAGEKRQGSADLTRGESTGHMRRARDTVVIIKVGDVIIVIIIQ